MVEFYSVALAKNAPPVSASSRSITAARCSGSPGLHDPHVIGDVAGKRAIILNRRWKPTSENERRWVLAEELGHVVLEHRLVDSTQQGKLRIGLLEPRRVFYEREAKAFAAELLMPFAEVRRRWFALSQDGMDVENMVRRLAGNSVSRRPRCGCGSS